MNDEHTFPHDETAERLRRERLKATDLEEFLEQRTREHRRDHAARNSFVPTKFALARFDNFETEPGNERALRAARAVADEPRSGVAFWGINGVGKSRLAASIVNEVIAKGECPAVMLNVNSILARIRETYDSRDTTERSEMHRIASCPVLVIDDVDKLRLTNWAVTAFYDLVTIRDEEYHLPLIVTGNSSYGDSLARVKYLPPDVEPATFCAAMERVLDMSEDPWIEMTGRNRRRAT
ncbi:MAG: hypothetical protein NVS2B17_31150 [Candidatus Velthaea sp.]